jgi:predicted metal-dependent peptidase
MAVTETEGILKAIGAEITFMTCDAEIGTIKKVRNIKDACASLVGGGGTSFVPVFDAVIKMNPMPEVLVFLTDGYGDAPHAPPPKLKTVWVLVGTHVDDSREPYFPGESFGEIIRFELESNKS